MIIKKCECGGDMVRKESLLETYMQCNKCKRKEQPAKDALKKHVTDMAQAHENFCKELSQMLENYNKLYEHIKPLLNKEMAELADKIHVQSVTLPLAHIVLRVVDRADMMMVKETTKLSVPPLKITCPKCQTVCWDITEIRKYLDPDGVIYGKV